MKNLFQQLHEQQTLPEDLEKQILDSYDTIKLIMDVTDLFTVKFGKSELEMHTEMEHILRTKQKKLKEP